MYLITPESRRTSLIATFITPVSHHDPSQKNRANISTFLRKKQIVERSVGNIPTNEQVQALIAKFFVPTDLAPVFQELTVAQFLAVALLQQFVSAHSTAEGVGLFSGIERYRRLEERAQFHGIRSASIFGWWGGMAADLQVGQPVGGDNSLIASLIGMPSALTLLVMTELVDNATTSVMLARMWNDALKSKSVNTTSIQLSPVMFTETSNVVASVPAFSANSARHEIVREPGMLHLLNAIDLDMKDLSDGAAAMLYNGGDLNRSAPGGAFKLTRDVRSAYPLLSLIGGSTAGFILGSSNLEVSTWIVCKENQFALNNFDVIADVSVFDLLDREELTRHTSKRVEGSPMPYGFEVLIPGTKVLIDFRLRPYVTDLEVGAFVAAVETFTDSDSTLGGQSARGYGLTMQKVIASISQDTKTLRKNYEDYLKENKDSLRDGLLDGTLTTGKDLF